jgi:capsid protein
LAGVTIIDDANAAGTATTFSASKITTLLDALKADLLGGADAAFDTLKELQDALLNDQTGIAALLAAVDKRVRFDAVQALTAPEQEQARQNIGAVSALDIGNFDTDFVAAFEAALVA